MTDLATLCAKLGIDQAKADQIVAAAGFSGTDAAEIARVLQLLGSVYEEEDATLVEVNPLVKTADGRIIALDAKVSLDENASFRHPDHATVVLPGWHRVLMNTEQGARAMRHVVFLD